MEGFPPGILLRSGFGVRPSGFGHPAPADATRMRRGHGVAESRRPNPEPRFLAILLLAVLLPSVGWGGCKEESFTRRFLSPPKAYAAESNATLKYFGHNFFQIVTPKGTKIVTDPLAPGWYPPPSLAAHVVTIGREHMNHNWVPIVGGRPMVLRGLKDTEDGWDWRKIRTQVKDALIYNVPIYNVRRNGDITKGAAFVFDLGVLCIVHLGDLSHELSPKLLKAIGKPDIVLVPIGGGTTMDADTAQKVIRQLNPKLAIPMHYRDDLDRVRRFAAGFPVKYLEKNVFEVSKAALPAKTEIVVMRYPGAP